MTAKKWMIRVEKCPDPLLWYAKHIGESFPFIREIPDEKVYMTREPAGYLNIIHFEDGCVYSVEDA